MKYLITGLTGFVGPHLAKHLIENNHQVVGTYRYFNKIDKMQDILENLVDKITMIRCDFKYETDIENLIRYHHFDGIFNLGAMTSIPESFNDPRTCFQINALATINLCDNIKKYNPKCNLLHCSTGEVYGPSTINGGSINETHPLNPINPYGVAKAAADHYIVERSKNSNLRACIVRPFSHSGPRRPKNFSISSDAIQIARILLKKQEPIIKVGNLQSQRTLIDVRDIVKVYYQLMQKQQEDNILSGEIYNIGGESLHYMSEYIQIMCKHFNINNYTLQTDSKLFRPNDVPVFYPDNLKIKHLLKWQPEIPLDKTLIDLVQYWRKYEHAVS